MPYRIVTIDGGGLRGLLTCTILERLEGVSIGYFKQADLIAGTSTGSILALGLAYGVAPIEIRRFYEGHGSAIFQATRWRRLRSLGFSIAPRYGNKRLKEALLAGFGDVTLGELPKKVLIPTFSLATYTESPLRVRMWRPKFFNNFQAADLNEKVVDVALRSCAAPTYFPSYQRYVDGGLATNNPSMAALAQALDPETGGQQLRDVVLLSLGTGRYPQYLDRGELNWGWVQWARPLVDMLMQGNTSVAHYQCQRLLNRRYHRLNPVFQTPIPLDDPNQLKKLEQFSMKLDLTPTLRWIEANWHK